MFKKEAAITSNQIKTRAWIPWLTALILSSPVCADTQLNITGRIKASSCNINLPIGGLIVDLGQNITASSLTVAGSSSDWRSFSIELNKCPISIREATMTLSGTPDQIVSTMYANTGTSSRLQIEVQDSDGKPLGNGQQMVQDVDSIAHGTTFKMQARAYSAQGNVTPGTIVGTMQVTFTYQ